MLSKQMSGIYKITNLFNGSFYIGSSCNLQQRFSKHWRELKTNKHHNSRLQRSVNKYGLENFTFEIIDYCEDTNLLELEQFYIDTLEPQYNICKIAGHCLGVKRSDETRKKLSDISKSKLGADNSRSKKVIQLNLDGEFINEYPGVREAERQTDIIRSGISAVCRGERNHAGGFFWKYAI